MTTLTEKLAQLPKGRRAAIEAEADRLHAEYLTLKELRKARDLTQHQLAETLGIRQATVAQMEKRSDLMLSTLRSYVEAMGGRLSLTVEFPGKPPVHRYSRFRAALTSRSAIWPHLQRNNRCEIARSCFTSPHALHIFDDGYQRSATSSRLPKMTDL